jgi:hypothetical protein
LDQQLIVNDVFSRGSLGFCNKTLKRLVAWAQAFWIRFGNINLEKGPN